MSTSLIDKQEKERKHHGVTLMQLKLMNTLAFILTIVLNYISSAGLISPYGVGTISRKYPTKITPASGAFAIWAYIYCLEALFVVYQYFWPKKNEETLFQIGFWYLSTCSCNSLWIIVFVQGTTLSCWISTLIIFGILFSLCKIHINTFTWKNDRPPIQFLLLEIHFSLYAGWVTIASIVNTSVSLTTVWTADASTASTCSVVMLVIAFLLNTAIIVRRVDCVWGWVLVWASYFISQSATAADSLVYSGSIIVCVLTSIVSTGAIAFKIFMWVRGRNTTEEDRKDGKTNTSNDSIEQLTTGVTMPSEV